MSIVTGKKNNSSYFSSIGDDQLKPVFLDYLSRFDRYLREDVGLSGERLIDMIYSVPASDLDFDKFIEESDPHCARTLHLAMQYEFDQVANLDGSKSSFLVIEDLFESCDLCYKDSYSDPLSDELLNCHGIVGMSNGLLIADDLLRLAMTRVYYMALQYNEQPVTDDFSSPDDLGRYLRSHSRSLMTQFKIDYDSDIPIGVMDLTEVDFFKADKDSQRELLEIALSDFGERLDEVYPGSEYRPFNIMALASRWPVEHIRASLVMGRDAKVAIDEAQQAIEVILDLAGMSQEQISEKAKIICMLAVLPYPTIFKEQYKDQRIPIDIAFGQNEREVGDDYAFPYYSGFYFDEVSSKLNIVSDFMNIILNDYNYPKDDVINQIYKLKYFYNFIPDLLDKVDKINKDDINSIVEKGIPRIKNGTASQQLEELLWIEKAVRTADNDALKMEYNKAIIYYATTNPNYAAANNIPVMIFSEKVDRKMIASYLVDNKIEISNKIMQSGGLSPSDISGAWKNIIHSERSKIIQRDLGM